MKFTEISRKIQELSHRNPKNFTKKSKNYLPSTKASMALATQPGIAVNANIMCQTNMISLREKYFPQIDKAPASQPAVTWQKVFLCHEQCLKCSETNLRWQYMYVGGLICQKTVDWSHFGSSEVIQRFCPRSQRVVATVCLFVKSGVKWHRETVTLSIGSCLWSNIVHFKTGMQKQKI